MHPDLDYILFSEEQLRQRVAEIGASLSAEYAGREPMILCILKGSIVFTADLMRALTLPCTLETLTLSSYREMSLLPGELELKDPFDIDVAGKDIIIVEDILDTGKTLKFVYDLLSRQGVSSLKLVVLLDKPSRRTAEIEADIVGFTIPDAFVVGYGLDFNQQYRNLPCIGVLKPEIYTTP